MTRATGSAPLTRSAFRTRAVGALLVLALVGCRTCWTPPDPGAVEHVDKLIDDAGKIMRAPGPRSPADLADIASAVVTLHRRFHDVADVRS